MASVLFVALPAQAAAARSSTGSRPCRTIRLLMGQRRRRRVLGCPDLLGWKTVGSTRLNRHRAHARRNSVGGRSRSGPSPEPAPWASCWGSATPLVRDRWRYAGGGRFGRAACQSGPGGRPGRDRLLQSGADQYQWGAGGEPVPDAGGEVVQVADGPPTTFDANRDFDATWKSTDPADGTAMAWPVRTTTAPRCRIPTRPISTAMGSVTPATGQRWRWRGGRGRQLPTVANP